MKKSSFTLIMISLLILVSSKQILAQTGPSPTPITQWTNYGFEIRNPYGALLLGPLNNSGWCHIYTDRTGFIFNKPVFSMNGQFSSYYETDLQLQTGNYLFPATTRVTIKNSTGYVGIGCTNPIYPLCVNGKIQATEVEIKSAPCSDYVFEKNYNLRKLSEVEEYVNTHKHLPEVPSAAEFAKNGYSVGQMDDVLLRKVEELTLYVIELKKEIEKLKYSK